MGLQSNTSWKMSRSLPISPYGWAWNLSRLGLGKKFQELTCKESKAWQRNDKIILATALYQMQAPFIMIIDLNFYWCLLHWSQIIGSPFSALQPNFDGCPEKKDLGVQHVIHILSSLDLEMAWINDSYPYQFEL